jgi:hypothetical protein
MRHLDIKAKVAELLPTPPDWEKFVRLGNLTKLRQNEDGTFRQANYESGLFLYALVRHFRPQRLLEIGTGRGYGAFCMAMALRDNGGPGQIITLDVKAYDEKQAWPLDDGGGARAERLSLQDVWEKYLDPDLRARIQLRQGLSTQALADLMAAGDFQPDFVYVDGDHTYTITRADVFASLLMARPPLRMVLDDYSPVYGVQRFVRQTLAPVAELEAVYQDGRWYGGPNEQAPIRQEQDYAQILFDSDKLKAPWEQAFPAQKLRQVVEGHRRWGQYSLRWEYAGLRLQRALGWRN